LFPLISLSLISESEVRKSGRLSERTAIAERISW
jgi:hypothetical protein